VHYHYAIPACAFQNAVTALLLPVSSSAVNNS
jgi:hypothetical protein